MLLDAVIAGIRRPNVSARRLVADLEAQEMVASPIGAPAHAAWALGHLVVSCQAIGEELDLAHWLEEPFRALFATGSHPTPDAGRYPSRDELLDRLADGEARVVAAVRALGAAGLARPLPDARYRSLLPTSAHALVYASCNHAAYHVGLLAAWRKAAGFPPASPFAP
jgi:hypothetical protein